jgi:hypothetical protein
MTLMLAAEAGTLRHSSGRRNAPAVAVDTIGGVERLLDPGVSVLLWRRQRGAHNPCPWPMVLAPGGLDYRTVVRVSPDAEVDPGLFAGRMPALLARDVALLVELVAVLADAREVGVRLVTLTRRMCPRFHVDRVGLRVTCAYQGPGTEWLDPADVDHRWLGRPLPGGLASGDPVARPGATPHRAATGDVLFMKGELGVDAGVLPAVHRSPDLPPGTQRIVLTLDPLD